jgi:D-beta-D-heptose 7-phosphate kinase/D-beta-D-heptose 1-phosphate adenosyltransferase
MIIRRKKDLYKLTELTLRPRPNLILTNGAFDILHLGHSKHLQNLKHIAAQNTTYGLRPEEFTLFVAVNSDISYQGYRGYLPTIEETSRLISVDNLECVDFVYLMQELEPSSLLTILKPNFYIKGPDRGEPHQWPEWPLIEAMQAEHQIKCLVDKTTGYVRSSDIKRNIKEQDERVLR